MPTAPAASKQAPSAIPIRRKEPEFFNFQLTKKHPEYFKGSSPYPPRYQVKREDTILWAYRNDVPLKLTEQIKTDSEGNPDPEVYFEVRRLRYIAGHPSPFVDEQEKNDRPLQDRLLNDTKNHDNLVFEKGRKKVDGADKALRTYLWCMSECKNQHPNAKTLRPTNDTYELLDNTAATERQLMIDEMRDKAYELATKAERAIMLPHAKYMGILFTHETGEDKEERLIRVEYKKKAMDDPYKFMESFNKPEIKLIYTISQLIEKQEITINGISSGQVHWVGSGKLIANLPQDQEPIPFLAKFALSTEGEAFGEALKANQVK